jgi:hypothetical protein
MNLKEDKKKDSEKSSLFKKFNLLRIVLVNNPYQKRGISKHKIVSEILFKNKK